MGILLWAGQRRDAFGFAILHYATSSASVEHGSWIRLYLLIAVIPCYAQTRPPGFDAYTVEPAFPRHSARVQINSGPDTRCFRTMLRATARSGQRFAGHYAILNWGCGTECARIGVVNLRSGKAYVSPFGVRIINLQVRPNSRLMIANSPEWIQATYGDAPPDYISTQYYVWDGARLRKLANGRVRTEPEREFAPCRK